MTLRTTTGINAGDPTRATLADLLNLNIPAWYADALCGQVDSDPWFPDAGGTTRRVRAICNGDPKRGTEPCPVRQQCLDFALEHNEAGVWGGVSERDRRKLRRQRQEGAA